MHGKLLVEGVKEVLADKLNKLEKKIQEYRKTMNLFIGSDIYKNHEIIEVYVQI
jgi:polysaccharide deacetylase 2 family uncharacterized protein YibQ